MKSAKMAPPTRLHILSSPSSRRRLRKRSQQERFSSHAALCEQLEDRTLLANFTVNTFADTGDANPGDGVALDLNGQTSLRAAIEEANARMGADSIFLNTPGNYPIGAELVITDQLVIQGTAANAIILDGGGSNRVMSVVSANVSISGLSITGGSAGAAGGGGIANMGGNLTLNAVRVNGNQATGGAGGGILFAPNTSSGSLIVLNSLIDDNRATRGAGIAFEQGAGNAWVINSTVALNIAVTDGGGIFYSQVGNALTIRNATIAANRVTSDIAGARSGGGLSVELVSGSNGPLPLLYNTIVAGNLIGTASVDASDIDSRTDARLVQSISSYNLIADGDTAGRLLDGVQGNIVGIGGIGTRPISSIINTLLADNGGPTFTFALSSNSPALDSGSNVHAVNHAGTPLPTDQRGIVSRIVDGNNDGNARVDMGAFEAPPSGGGIGNSPGIDIVGRNSAGSVVYLVSNNGSFADRPAGAVSPTVDWDQFVTGDFNGDGQTDWAGRSPSDGQWRVLLASGGTFAAPVIWGSWSTAVTFSDVRVGDFNGDGRDDITARASTGTLVVGLSTGSSFATSSFGAWSTSVTWPNVVVGDVNGDGRDDLIGRASTGTLVVAISNGSKFINSAFGAWTNAVTWLDMFVGDVNGDGRADLIGRASNGRWIASVSDGSRFTTTNWGAWASNVVWSDVRVGDFNGDGRTDFAGRSSGGTWVVGESTGTSFVNSVRGSWSTTVSWRSVLVGDFDGDGIDDIAGFASSGSWIVSISDGAQFTTTRWGVWSTSTSWDNISAGQFVV